MDFSMTFLVGGGLSSSLVITNERKHNHENYVSFLLTDSSKSQQLYDPRGRPLYCTRRVKGRIYLKNVPEIAYGQKS